MKQLISKRILPFILALLLGTGVWAANGRSVAEPVEVLAADYYAGIEATGGDALLGELHDLITTTHKKYTSYTDCKTPSTVKKTDAGSNGNVLEFYTRVDISSSWGSGSIGTWNREHVWCQSLSNGLWGQSGGGSDLHHIRPVESGLNSTRGNNKFGEVTGGNEAYRKNTSGNKDILGGYVGGGTFEPLNEVKGDVARIVMYVYTHYNTYSNVFGTTNGSGKASFGTLNFTNVMSASSEAAAIDLLLQWNSEDPVDETETARNDAVYAIQGNRNPFIDHPEYAEAIWGDDAPVTAVTGLTVSPKDVTLNAGLSKQLSVTVTPSGASKSVTWTSSDEKVATVSAKGVVTAVGTGTATITATSKITPSVQDSMTVTVPEKQEGGNNGEEGNGNGGNGNGGVIVQGKESVTIDVSSFQMSDGYGFKPWTAGELGGIAFIYGGNSAYPASGLQFNIKQASYYLASNTAAPGGIVSVTVKLKSGTERPWKLLTSDTAYGEVEGKPTEGTDHGTQTVTTEGTTWYLDGTQEYFALTYELEESSGACYIESVVVEYGVSEESPDPTPDSAGIIAFRAAVEKIEKAETGKAKHSAIRTAIGDYQALTEEEKAAVSAEYQTLQTAIENYNTQIGAHNEVMREATDSTLKGFGSFFRWVGALVEFFRSIWL